MILKIGLETLLLLPNYPKIYNEPSNVIVPLVTQSTNKHIPLYISECLACLSVILLTFGQ